MKVGPLSLIPREFSPAEFAKITGVHTALQRDWRRRGILPERDPAAGWSQYPLATVVEGSILNQLAEAGFSPKQMLAVASLALGSVLERLAQFKGAYVIVGIESDMENVRLGDYVPLETPYRFLVIKHQLGARGLTAAEFQKTVFPSKDFEAVRQIVEGGGSGWTIVDLHHLADQIVERAGLPLFRVEIADCPENAEILKAISEEGSQ
jgi:hypothetical protein